MKNTYNISKLIDEYTLPLTELFTSDEAVQKFVERFTTYTQQLPEIERIAVLQNGQLGYKSESFIPPIIDTQKPNLFVILGNPAPESVAMGAMFAYEGRRGRYHRFWRVLHDTGLLQFPVHPDELTPEAKMIYLYKGDYHSPFNLFFIPFFTFPTPPAGVWNGVAGARRLFGPAFANLAALDTLRIQQLAAHTLRDDDILLIFQKDAYQMLAGEQPHIESYNYHTLLSRPLLGTYITKNGQQAQFIGALPTRLLHSNHTKTILTSLVQHGTLRV